MIRIERQDGYTLVEMLLVLFIFGVLSVLAASFLLRMEKDVYEEAKDRFLLTLYAAQAQAIAEDQTYVVYVLDGEVRTRTDMEVISSWALPTNMSINISANTLRRITFYSTGKVMHIGTVHIQTPFADERYSINLSRGRLVLQ